MLLGLAILMLCSATVFSTVLCLHVVRPQTWRKAAACAARPYVLWVMVVLTAAVAFVEQMSGIGMFIANALAVPGPVWPLVPACAMFGGGVISLFAESKR